MERRLQFGALLLLLFSAVFIQSSYAVRYSRITTHLPCRPSVTGLFIVPGSCNEYYQCVQFRGTAALFAQAPVSCPPGRNFDDYYSECLPKRVVTSPARCIERPVEGSPHDAAITRFSASDITGPSDHVPHPGAAEIPNHPVAEATEIPHHPVAAAISPTQHAPRPVAEATDPVDPRLPSVAEAREPSDLGPSPADAAADITDNYKETFGDLDMEGQVNNETNNAAFNETDPATGTQEVGSLLESIITGHVCVIHNYTNQVISTPALRRSFEYGDYYKKISPMYNGVLEDARNITYLWRHGDSISTGIKITYRKAASYKGKFNQKREINKQIIGKIHTEKPDPTLDQMYNDSIKKLLQEIKDAEAALALTKVQPVRDFFEGVILSKQQEIEQNKLEKKSNTKEGRQLSELIFLLQFLRDDTRDVEDVAMHWQDQVDVLLINVNRDLIAFKEVVNSTNESIKSLLDEEDQLRYNAQADSNAQIQLDRLKAKKNDDLQRSNMRIIAINDQNLDLLTLMRQKTDIYNEKVAAVCQPNGVYFSLYNINENSTHEEILIACNSIVEQLKITNDISEELAKMKQLKRERKGLNRKVINILSEFDDFNHNLRQLYKSISVYEEKLPLIKYELVKFRRLEVDVMNLQDGADASINSLMVIKGQLQFLWNVFTSMRNELEGLISQGNGAENEEAKRREITAIEGRLDEIQFTVNEMEIPTLVKPCSQ